VGAAGAFGVLLAFGAGGKPGVVMSIVFAGAPVVNALLSLVLHPPAAGWGSIRPQFYLGILLAALGGCLVTLYKPGPAAPEKTLEPPRGSASCPLNLHLMPPTIFQAHQPGSMASGSFAPVGGGDSPGQRILFAEV